MIPAVLMLLDFAASGETTTYIVFGDARSLRDPVAAEVLARGITARSLRTTVTAREVRP